MKAFLALLLALAPLAASAQAYPSKPVKILVPAQPGGGLDLIGRTVADQLSRALDQSFIVENSGGGGGSIAAQTTAPAAPDGYTLMVGYVGTPGTNPAGRKLPDDAVRDFTPIAMVGRAPPPAGSAIRGSRICRRSRTSATRASTACRGTASSARRSCPRRSRAG